MTLHPNSKTGWKSGSLLAVLGAALFAWVIVHAGRSVVVEQLKALRIALPIVVALSSGRLLLQSWSWSAALKNEGAHVGLAQLIGIRLASQGMGYLTVFGPVVSEPMKIRLLTAPVELTARATFLDNGVYWFTSALAGIAGCACLSLIQSQATTSAVVLGVVFALVIVFIVLRQSVLGIVSRSLGQKTPSWLNRAAEIESSIRSLRVQQPRLVGRMFWIDLLCQLLMVAEVAVVFWALSVPLRLVTMIAVEGLTRAVKMMSGWLPARLGADEGGAMSAFAASGLSPSFGLTLALTRRVRDLLWALVGLIWLATESRRQREATLDEGTSVFEGGMAPCKSLL